MAKNRIVIVDDDKEFSEELKEMLVLNGYDPEVVNDSRSAVRAIRKIKPDLILLDIRMDGLDGFQVTEKLKERPETENIPIIAMTGYFTKEEHARLMQDCGIEKCFKKPFNAAELIDYIRLVLKGE